MKIDHTSPVPLYRQIADRLRIKIQSGEWKEGDRLQSHQELAETFGVSMITIKKAMAELVDEGIIYIRPGKGTFVAPKKPREEKVRHKTIGLVLSDLKEPFFSMVLSSVEEKASLQGYSMFLSNTSEQAEKEERQIHRFRELGVDGLIIASMTHVHRGPAPIRRLKEEGFPFVMVSYIEDEDIPYVGTDHALGAYLGTRHLVELGYRRIGYINAEEGNLLGELRKQGYSRALEDAGRLVDEGSLYRLKWEDYESGYEIGRVFSGLVERPDAMFAYSDVAALGFEQAVLDSGLSVPGDVAIVGFDDIERDLYAPVPLTTVHQPAEEIGAGAFAVLSKLMDGEQVRIRTILEPRLVVRKSCGAQ